MEEITSHTDELYPHFHHVMSRHRPKIPAGAPDHRIKKHRKVTDEAIKLPTIPDDQNVPVPAEHKEFEAAAESEDEPPKILFSVGHMDSETEEEPHHK